jgi:hypothetical protein
MRGDRPRRLASALAGFLNPGPGVRSALEPLVAQSANSPPRPNLKRQRSGCTWVACDATLCRDLHRTTLEVSNTYDAGHTRGSLYPLRSPPVGGGSQGGGPVDIRDALAEELGGGALLVLAGAFAVYLAVKIVRRPRFLRHLRIARITPDELKAKLDQGEAMFVVDLRHRIDVQAEPTGIPEAVHQEPSELEQAAATIPRDRDVVLYCT